MLRLKNGFVPWKISDHLSLSSVTIPPFVYLLFTFLFFFLFLSFFFFLSFSFFLFLLLRWIGWTSYSKRTKTLRGRLNFAETQNDDENMFMKTMIWSWNNFDFQFSIFLIDDQFLVRPFNHVNRSSQKMQRRSKHFFPSKYWGNVLELKLT